MFVTHHSLRLSFLGGAGLKKMQEVMMSMEEFMGVVQEWRVSATLALGFGTSDRQCLEGTGWIGDICR